MSLEAQLAAVLKLGLAALFSMLIGIDRQRRHQDAGLRTHMLVGTGACLFTVLSMSAFPQTDDGRVAAQIVSGIGFLGAGTIIKDRRGIQGLTTAASIWATSAVGMAVGADAWFLALCATLFIWFILAILRRWRLSID